MSGERRMGDEVLGELIANAGLDEGAYSRNAEAAFRDLRDSRATEAHLRELLRVAADALAEAFERVPYCPKGCAVNGECSGCSMPNVHHWFSGNPWLDAEAHERRLRIEGAEAMHAFDFPDHKHSPTVIATVVGARWAEGGTK